MVVSVAYSHSYETVVIESFIGKHVNGFMGAINAQFFELSNMNEIILLYNQCPTDLTSRDFIYMKF
jgi:hypothetical protein